MTKEQAFQIWAPPGGPWSAWVKPVLFAHLPHVFEPIEQGAASIDARWAPPADGRTALVIDLPGAQGIQLAAALVLDGYRPVLLYNAAPGPIGSPNEWGGQALVEVWPIIAMIRQLTPFIAGQKFFYGAPPAFVLDASRRVARGPVAPGRFDNRSVSFPTDFPSANLLLSRGIREVLLVQHDGNAPQPDLAHTLRRWQQAGIEIRLQLLEEPGRAPVPITVRRGSPFGWVIYRVLTLLRLRRHPLGGFGGVLPEPSSG